MSKEKQKACVIRERKVERRFYRDRRKQDRRDAEIVVYLTQEEIAALLTSH